MLAFPAGLMPEEVPGVASGQRPGDIYCFSASGISVQAQSTTAGSLNSLVQAPRVPDPGLPQNPGGHKRLAGP